MDTAKLCFMLLCVSGSWILSLAINCDWTTEYDFEKKLCCKGCPSGEYPKVPCQKSNSDSVCEKCPSNLASVKDRCFCKDNKLCSDDKCDTCETRQVCKPGQQLQRTGNFDYTYSCAPCPDNTYNDVENSACKSITKCVGVGEIFPGNQTHNAICVSSVSSVPNAPVTSSSPVKTENGIQSTHSFMLACLIVTLLTCLVFIMHSAFKIYKYKMLIKLRKPCTHVLPSDTCSCKLSKEEMGEGSDSITDVSEEYSKHDVFSFP